MVAISVPVVKGKGVVEIDADNIPDHVYKAIFEAGLKVFVNGGTSKITKTTYPDEKELQTVAMAKAQERVEEILKGTIKIPGKKAAGKLSGAVQTEALRLAKVLVKDQMREQGLKISHYKASEITSAAKELLEGMPELIETAKANIEERAKVPTAAKIDLSKIMKADPELVKKADAKKAEAAAKKPISAKQAGMTTKAKKGGAQAQA